MSKKTVSALEQITTLNDEDLFYVSQYAGDSSSSSSDDSDYVFVSKKISFDDLKTELKDTSNFCQPVSTAYSATLTITNTTPSEIYVNMTGAMVLSFDRSSFVSTESVFGIVYVKPNAYALTADATVEGLGDLEALVTGEYNIIIYNSVPESNVMVVR